MTRRQVLQGDLTEMCHRNTIHVLSYLTDGSADSPQRAAQPCFLTDHHQHSNSGQVSKERPPPTNVAGRPLPVSSAAWSASELPVLLSGLPLVLLPPLPLHSHTALGADSPPLHRSTDDCRYCH